MSNSQCTAHDRSEGCTSKNIDAANSGRLRVGESSCKNGLGGGDPRSALPGSPHNRNCVPTIGPDT
eukprot:9033191-Alexandrium_andersonii.AAC.2